MTSYDLNRLTQPAPASKPVPAPKPPVPVQREPREGVSGYFYKEVFWSLSIDERNAKMLRVNRDLALKMEWENITAAMRAPKEVLTPLSESEKTKAFAPPTQRPQNRVFATGQIQTIDAARAPFQPTMANGDGGISIEPDKRGWLPDINPLSLTPSR
jgi:hypothetical protein